MIHHRDDDGKGLALVVILFLSVCAMVVLFNAIVEMLAELWATSVAVCHATLEAIGGAIAAYGWLVIFPIFVWAVSRPSACRWMIEQWATRDAMAAADAVEVNALFVAGRALAGAIPASSQSPEAVMLAERRGWIVLEGDMVLPAAKFGGGVAGAGGQRAIGPEGATAPT